VLGFGDPVYDGPVADAAPATRSAGVSLSRLPLTAVEVGAVADRAHLREKASETALRAELIDGKSRMRAVHLACHGVLDPERPLLSSVVLTADAENDGYLTALEVLELPVRADLVAISACESGRGKVYRGEGLLGLTRSFMYAGAPRIVCSQWKVDDRATQALMVKFYELWKDPQSGRSAASALRAARAHVRGRKGWEHPYYWAAWTLWGVGD
jgi:CHAT domain-containing protein